MRTFGSSFHFKLPSYTCTAQQIMICKREKKIRPGFHTNIIAWHSKTAAVYIACNMAYRERERKKKKSWSNIFMQYIYKFIHMNSAHIYRCMAYPNANTAMYALHQSEYTQLFTDVRRMCKYISSSTFCLIYILFGSIKGPTNNQIQSFLSLPLFLESTRSHIME